MNFLNNLVKPKPVKRFASDTGGNVAMMFGFLSLAIFGSLAVAIDLSSAYSAKQRLQNTTDAVALIAARDGIEDQGELQALAQAYFDQAYPNAGESGSRIEVLNINRDGDTVDISTRNNIDTTFGQFFGHSDLDISVDSSTTFAQKPLDLALVLDTTGSMAGSKLANLQASATSLMDTLESFDNDKLRVSIVPFAQYVNAGDDQRNQAWVDGRSDNRDRLCMGSRTQPLNTQPEFNGASIPVIADANCGAAIQPLTGDFRALKRTISDFEARGLTYMPSGLLWGWRTLEASAPFTEASTSQNGEKVLVLMTDGANTVEVQGNEHTRQNRNSFNPAAANNLTQDICNRVKGSDIKVYTIAFEVDDANTRNLLRNCASEPENFFNAQNGSELDEAFTNIGSTLNELRITS